MPPSSCYSTVDAVDATTAAVVWSIVPVSCDTLGDVVVDTMGRTTGAVDATTAAVVWPVVHVCCETLGGVAVDTVGRTTGAVDATTAAVVWPIIPVRCDTRRLWTPSILSNIIYSARNLEK